MKKNSYIFLSQLIAATQGQKQFFISKQNKSTRELASVFMELNVIKKVTDPSNEIMRGMPIFFRNKYKVFWLKNHQNSTHTLNAKSSDRLRSNSQKNMAFYNKIKVVSPKRYHMNVIRYKDLINKMPTQNTVFILQTPTGIITSIEAVKRRLGGFVICIISLLLLFSLFK